MAVIERHKRLLNDERALRELEKEVNWGGRTRLEVQPIGQRPILKYKLVYHCTGYVDESGRTSGRHEVDLVLPEQYPLTAAPDFWFVTPIVHPHVFTNPRGRVCLGDAGKRWKPTIQLDHLVLHIARLIRLDPEPINPTSLADGRDWSFWEQFLSRFPNPADNDPIVPRDSGVRMPGLPTPTSPAEPRGGTRVQMPPIRPALATTGEGAPPTGSPRGRIVIRRP